MPLPLANVNLDDRRWADLVEEGRALIPRHAPDWSDHNVSDPGITLIELFAWLTDQYVYRLNQVPERHRRKFLDLIGFTPRPPQPAQTVLAIRSWDLEPVVIPSGFEFETDDTEGRSVSFRTLRDLTLAPVKLTTLRVEADDETLLDHTRDWAEGLSLSLLGDEPRPGTALCLGFKVSGDVQLPAGIPISLAFHFEGPGTGPAARIRLMEEASRQRLAQGPVLPDIQCPHTESDELEQALEMALSPHHSARLVWEVQTNGNGSWTPLDPATNEASPSPGQIRDDTRSLTLDGIVEFNLPFSIEPAGPDSVDLWLRCRLETGAYDAAPVLRNLAINAVTVEQAVGVDHSFLICRDAEVIGAPPAIGEGTHLSMELDSSGAILTLTFFDRESEEAQSEDYPEILVLGFQPNSDDEFGNLTLDIVPVGVGNGLPEQEIVLPRAPVQQSSVALYTHLGEHWETWTRREDLDASSRSDRHFTLHASTGTIRFGDGERGRVPEATAFILARYRSTRTEDGNLRAEANFRPATTTRNDLLALPQDVSHRLGELTYNPLDARGGAGAETLARATGRAIETLHAHERLVDLAAENKQRTLDQVPSNPVRSIAAPSRGVNLLDLECLALDVPGTRIARARAWAGVHPAYPCLHAAGVVTIVILPYLPLGRPEPSPGLLAVVRRYLDCRRMVTTRLEVVGPTYLGVSVIADVCTKAHVDTARVHDQIVQAIDAFLDPLSGGPDGLGWPFGRDVFRTEVLQLIDEIPGVDHVLDLNLVSGNGEPRCGNAPLCPTWLVFPGAHRIRVNPPADRSPQRASEILPCPPPNHSESDENVS